MGCRLRVGVIVEVVVVQGGDSFHVPHDVTLVIIALAVKRVRQAAERVCGAVELARSAQKGVCFVTFAVEGGACVEGIQPRPRHRAVQALAPICHVIRQVQQHRARVATTSGG